MQQTFWLTLPRFYESYAKIYFANDYNYDKKPVIKATDPQWSHQEEEIAQEAFNKAYQREIEALIQEVGRQAEQAQAAEDLWHLHDLLSAKRHEIDGKYHFDNCAVLFVLAELVKGGWLNLQELQGLEKDKVSKIKALTLM